MKPIVFLDTETGGLDHRTRPVLQIALGIPKLNKYLNISMQPGGLKVDDEALKINKIKRVDLHNKDRLTQWEGAVAVAGFIADHIGSRAEVVCHNEKFDSDFVQSWFERVDVPFRSVFHYQWECTLKLFLTLRQWKIIRPQSLKLGDLCAYFDAPLENAHDALGDIHATIELYKMYHYYMSAGRIADFGPGAHKRMREEIESNSKQQGAG